MNSVSKFTKNLIQEKQNNAKKFFSLKNYLLRKKFTTYCNVNI